MPWQARKAQLNRSLTEATWYAYKNSPTMHKRMANLGVDPQDIKTIEDLFKIPVTRKDELIKIQKECPPFGGLLAVPIERLERIYLSPGPIFDPHQADAYARCATTLYAAGFRENDIVLNTL